MAIAEYRLAADQVDIDQAIPDPAFYKGLTAQLLAAWQQQAGAPVPAEREIPVEAVVRLRTEGLSPADVADIRFAEVATHTPVAAFIARTHNGPTGADKAATERDVVRAIAATGVEAFSSSLLLSSDLPRHVVVYRHADDAAGRPLRSLANEVADLLRARDDAQIQLFCPRLRSLMSSVDAAYQQIGGPPGALTGSAYYERTAWALAPDLTIDLRKVAVKIDEKYITAEHDGTFKGDPDSTEHLAGQQLFDWVSLLQSNKRWVHAHLRLSLRPWGRAYVRCEVDGIRIGLYLTDTDRKELMATKSTSFTLCCYLKDHLVTAVADILDQRELPKSAWLQESERRRVFATIKQVRTTHQHDDLHAGNILAGGETLKVIDLGSLGSEAVCSSRARLELSLWQDLAVKTDLLTAEDAALVLETRSAVPDRQLKARSWVAWALGEIVAAIRPAVATDPSPGPISDIDTVTAYASQVFTFERYWLEREIVVPPALGVVARFWIEALRRVTVMVRPVAPIPGAVDVAPSLGVQPPEMAVDIGDAGSSDGAGAASIPGAPGQAPLDSVAPASLLALWGLAVRAPGTNTAPLRGANLLRALRQEHGDHLAKQLTPLQQRLWDSGAGLPFQSDRHIIVASPTGSGKSTAAEMFLAGPWIWGDERQSSLYIAPTRALAQAKHRDLLHRFSGYPQLQSAVLLSTGEDTDHDRDILHGSFAIACLVYEKANILFSRNRKLLQRLGCMVVDEMHMMANLDRGPILEMCLTKVLQQRQTVEGTSARMRRDVPRIIAITTEDAPDRSLEAFLTVTLANGSELKPLVYRDSTRPVIANHWLILPSTAGRAFEEFRIVQFDDASKRTLSGQNLQGALRRLANAGPAFEVRSQPGRQQQEMEQRLIALLVARLAHRQTGYRVLVFVPSREQAVRLARVLKNKRGHAPATLEHRGLLAALKDVKAEDTEMAQTLRDTALAGVLIHHGDMERKLREAVERVFGEPCDGATPSQVLFTTETLSYGVNLAVSDVVLLGTLFNTRDRQRVFEKRKLDQSQYHNMAGRAGRLGLSDGTEANVYVVLPADESVARTAELVIEDYYSSVDPLDSKLFVSDDSMVMTRQESLPLRRLRLVEPDPGSEYAVYSTAAAVDFSDPFIRAVLDALRHVNRFTAIASGDRLVGQPLAEIYGLFASTLYAHLALGAEQTGNPKHLRYAIQRVLDDCAKAPLQLVKAEQAEPVLYTIMPRGEAILDTGTEIRTIEPLLELRTRTRQAWHDAGAGARFPSEIHLLCLLAQVEVCRQCIAYAPEIVKGAALWHAGLPEANRHAVAEAFIAALRTVGVAEPGALAKRLTDMLDSWQPLRRVVPETYSEAYPFGATDSILRFFNAMVAWTHGAPRDTVFDLVEKSVSEHLNGDWQSFIRFTDMLFNKCQFLSKLLSPDDPDAGEIGLDEERDLVILAFRLRLGCRPEAIPLFYPQGSNVNRMEAEQLLAAGLNAHCVLSVRHLEDAGSGSLAIPLETLEQLRSDLERYAVKEFGELRHEMTVDIRESVQRLAIRNLWDDMAKRFPTSIEAFRALTDTAVDVDGMLRQQLDFVEAEEGEEIETVRWLRAREDDATFPRVRGTADSRYRLGVSIPADGVGIVLIGEKSAGDRAETSARAPQRVHEVRVVGIQVRDNWTGCIGAKGWRPLEEILVDLYDGRPLVLVPFPWLPDQGSMPAKLLEVIGELSRREGYVLTFASPAAFGCLVGFVVRDFISGEAFIDGFAKRRNASPFGLLGARSLLRALDDAGAMILPDIREKLLQFFEVEFVWVPPQ